MRLRGGLVLVVGLVVLLVGAGVASAGTYTVNTVADSIQAGGCVQVQTCSLRDAVIAANHASGPSTITVPDPRTLNPSAATYALTTPARTADDATNGDLDITTTNPVQITGAATTTIDANFMDRAFAVASGASLTLSGVTVVNGVPAANSSGRQNGGAIYSAGVLTLVDDILTGNAASVPGASGGAVDQTGSGALTISGTTFTANMAAGAGGAVADSSAGALTVTGDTFGTVGGSARDGNTVTTGAGGALADLSSSTATINDSVFTGNQAPGTSGTPQGGGALYLGGSSYTLDRDEFNANQSASSGGAILWTTGTLTSDSSSFIFNTAGTGAGAGGGAVAATGSGPLTLVDATLDSNTAGSGGGIFFGASPMPVDLVNDTIYNNQATGPNAGNALAGTSGLSPHNLGVQNTIIGRGGPGSVGISGPDCARSSAATPLLAGDADRGHNFNPDGSCLATPNNGDQIGTALTLSTPANNGGTVLTDAEPSGAPTIDAGTGAPVCPGFDAAGTNRPQGSACDIGAYELFVPPPTQPTTVTTTLTVTAPGSPTPPATPAPPTPGTPPVATTRGVLGTQATSAFLGGTVNARRQATSYVFQVGTTRFYGLTTVTGHTDVAVLSVDTLIQRLKPSTLYHYRLVASNAAGTSYGADRTFRTAPVYDGSLKLGSTKLTVQRGDVLVPLTCASAHACVLRFSITIRARLAGTHKLGTLSFTKSTTTLTTIRAHRTVTVSTGVNPAALTLLQNALHHRLAGKFSTRPRTNQLGIISAVTLASK